MSSYVQWYSIIVGLVLVLIVLFAPHGLLGARQWLRARPAGKAEPVSHGAMLEVERVSRNFGALAALVDVSFSVRAGEVFSVIGPNGAGKSTLFNVITGLHAPSGGRVVFLGEDIAGLPPEVINRRGLAKTFQITNVFPGISVYDNVRSRGPVARARLGPSRLALAARPTSNGPVMELLGAFGLEKRRDELAATCPTASSDTSRSAWRWRPSRSSCSSTSRRRA